VAALAGDTGHAILSQAKKGCTRPRRRREADADEARSTCLRVRISGSSCPPTSSRSTWLVTIR